MELPQELIFNIGDVIFIKKYDYEDGGTPTDKLLIVLHKGKDKGLTYISFSLTTSQLEKSGISGLYRNEGCTVLEESPKLHFYFFKKNAIVGDINFSFKSDTVIIFQNNVRYRPLNDFKKYKPSDGTLKREGNLSNVVLKALIECALNSEHIPGYIETKLNESLAEVNKLIEGKNNLSEVSEE